jgi:hypothetical protein
MLARFDSCLQISAPRSSHQLRSIAASRGRCSCSPQSLDEERPTGVKSTHSMDSKPHPLKRKVVAYHEAGHAVVACTLGLRLRRVTIIPSEDLLGCCQQYKSFRGKYFETGDPYRVRLRTEKHIMVALAGRIAQQFYNRRSLRPHHGRSDMENAAQLAMSITGSTKETNAYMEWLELRTGNSLKDSLHWEAVKVWRRNCCCTES